MKETDSDDGFETAAEDVAGSGIDARLLFDQLKHSSRKNTNPMSMFSDTN